MSTLRFSNRYKHIIQMVCFIIVCLSSISAQTFTSITTGSSVTEPGAWRSVNWVDYDHDGNLDLLVTRGKAGGQDNVLFRNDGPPSYFFTRMSDLVLSQDHEPSDGSTWADYDNDGYLDAFTANWYNHNNLLYKNNGNGSFTRILAGSVVTDGGYSETGSWGDYNNDGLIDLYVANSAGSKQNFLYKNLGGGQFQRVLTGAPATDVATSRGVSWVDYDDDGDLDLFVANEVGENESLYKNMLKESGVDTFVHVSGDPLVTSGGSSWSGSWADYDNDGDQDVFVVNQSGEASKLFINNGNGSFTPLASGAVVTDVGYGASAAWADMDNDGDLDLVVSHAYSPAPVTNYLYKNLLIEMGIPTLERITTGPLVTDAGFSYGLSWGDYDNDGDLDLFVARTLNEDQTNTFYQNDGNANHWLTLECRGTGSNAAGIGAIIRTKAMINGQPTWQLRAIEGQSGYCGQNLQVHFGLGDADVIDSLVVVWPSGLSDVFTQVIPNRQVCIIEDSVTAPALLSPEENFITYADTALLAWRRDLCGRPYRIQIATDATFSNAIVYEDSTISDTTYTVYNLLSNARYYWRVQPSRTVDRNTWSAIRSFAIAPFTFTTSVTQAWNMVSVPLEVVDYRATALFPLAVSPAYSYDGNGYVANDTLTTTRGYWIRFSPPQPLSLTGVVLLDDTIHVDSGWNLIGALSYSVLAASLISDPADNIISKFFAYDNAYIGVDTLKPWRGYWVKAKQTGTLAAHAGEISNEPQGKVVIPDEANSITFENRNGNKQSLYFTKDLRELKKSLDRYSLPPQPPDGMFDVRFASGRFLEAAEENELSAWEIRMSGGEFPMKVRWNIRERLNNVLLRMNDGLIPIKGQGSMMITSGEKIELLVNSVALSPKAFEIKQNYPNPFNPLTVIRYQLPNVERNGTSRYNVVLKVYNLLGQVISTLVDGTQDAGYQSATWDASNMASGIYLYKLEAVSTADAKQMFTEARKMVLIK